MIKIGLIVHFIIDVSNFKSPLNLSDPVLAARHDGVLKMEQIICILRMNRLDACFVHS
jgi:hypothetical protein